VEAQACNKRNQAVTTVFGWEVYPTRSQDECGHGDPSAVVFSTSGIPALLATVGVFPGHGIRIVDVGGFLRKLHREKSHKNRAVALSKFQSRLHVMQKISLAGPARPKNLANLRVPLYL
jgi:hypothetical protein